MPLSPEPENNYVRVCCDPEIVVHSAEKRVIAQKFSQVSVGNQLKRTHGDELTLNKNVNHFEVTYAGVISRQTRKPAACNLNADE